MVRDCAEDTQVVENLNDNGGMQHLAGVLWEWGALFEDLDSAPPFTTTLDEGRPHVL